MISTFDNSRSAVHRNRRKNTRSISDYAPMRHACKQSCARLKQQPASSGRDRGRIRGTMPFFGEYFAYFVPVLMLATAAWYLAILWLLWRIARALERRPV